MIDAEVAQIERDGYFGNYPDIAGECDICGCEIFKGDGYEPEDGVFICEEYDCIIKYMKQFRNDGD